MLYLIPEHTSSWCPGITSIEESEFMKGLAVKSRDFLYEQLKDYILNQYRLGKYSTEVPIPSERVLAQELEISRSTVRIALSKLQDEGFVEKIKSKGTFIKEQGKSKIKIAIVFPEPEISLDYLRYSNFMATQEIFRGILTECAQNNITASFIYANDGEKNYDNIAKDIMNNYDGALFFSTQLSNLKDIFQTNNFPFYNVSEQGNGVFYNRKNAISLAGKFMLESDLKNIAFLYVNDENVNEKINYLRAIYAENGVWIKDENIYSLTPITENEQDIIKELRKIIPENKNDLLDCYFCSTQIIGICLIELAKERTWKIGEDINIMGYANNTKLRPTIPMLTHIEIPYFAMGAKACEVLLNKVLNNIEIPKQILLEGNLVVGESIGTNY